MTILTPRCPFALVLVLVGALLLGAACDRAAGDGAAGGGGGAAERAAPAAAPPTAQPSTAPPPSSPPPSARQSLAVWRPLVDEAARAELDVGGVFVDLGSVDGHKYTLGGFGGAWGHNETTRDETYAPILTPSATLRLPDDPQRPATRLHLRLRSRCPGQTVTASLDGVALGDAVAVGEAWQEVSLAVPGPASAPTPGMGARVAASERTLRLDLASVCDGGAAHLDWLWLAADAAAPVPAAAGPRHGPLALAGGTRRALLAPSPRALHFYLEPPTGAVLVFEHGAEGTAELAVFAEADGLERRELWRGHTEAGAWREQQVELSAFAGRATRLTLAVLATDGGVAGFAEPDLMVPRASVAAPPPAFGAPPRGAIVVAVDGLRADAASDSATLARLAARGVWFERAWASGPWARPSAASLLSGLYPVTHAAQAEAARLSDEVELLPELLAAAAPELSSAAFVASGAVAPAFGFDQGFAHFAQPEPASADALYGAARAWLAAQPPGQPFFVYVQPNEPQLALAARDEAAPDALRARYHEAVAAHDAALGRFVDALEADGLLDETLLVVVGSHGVLLGEREGELGARPQRLDAELLHVPMVLRLPGTLPEGLRLSEPVEGVDVAPSVVEALGLPASELHQGVSLLPLIAGDPVQRPYYALGMVEDTLRAVQVGSARLVRHADGRDEGSTGPIARRMCEVYLGEGLANETKRRRLDDVRHDLRFDSVEIDVDPALKGQLESLGYFGD